MLHSVPSVVSRTRAVVDNETCEKGKYSTKNASKRAQRCSLRQTHVNVRRCFRLAPLIGTNDIVKEYIEAVAHEAFSDEPIRDGDLNELETQ